MDILNWLFIKKQQLIKKEANDAATDLVVLGADVPFTTRGDGYQSYGMTLADAVASGNAENGILRTGIYDNFPFPIGYPVLSKTSTSVIDTPSSPTFISVNLQGWKISGSADIDDGSPNGSVYLGTISYNTPWFWPAMPWKTTGTVFTYDQNSDTEIYSTLANGAFMYDSNANTVIPANVYITVEYYDNEFDMYLIYDQADGSAEINNTTVSFEFEFLHEATDDIKFIYY